MRPQIVSMRPIIIFHDNYRIIRGNVCLIENESLLLRTGPFVFIFFDQAIINIFIFGNFLLQKGDSFQERLFLLNPFLLFF